MQVAGLRDPLDQRIRADDAAFAVQKETEVKIFSWRPSKDLARSVVEKVTDTFMDSNDFEDLELNSEEWETGGEDGGVPTTSTAFPKMKMTPQYDREDWDKELEDSENNSKPYDLDDFIHYENFLDQDPAASCSIQGQPLYDPSMHHVAPLTLSQIESVLVDGQFDDATD